MNLFSKNGKASAWYQRRAVLLIGIPTLILSEMANCGGFPNTTNAGRPLFNVRGPDAPCGNGDITVNQASPCFAAVSPRRYEFYIEVPPGTSNLTVEIFDPDVGSGGNAEATAGRDAINTGSNVAAVATGTTYVIADSLGAAVTQIYSRGDSDEPLASDNIWATIYSGASPLQGVWRISVTGIQENPPTAGQSNNYFGVRACATSNNSGNARCSSNISRDLNVYARSFLHLGNQNAPVNESFNEYSAANGNSILHPYVTHGCEFRGYDFDNDGEAVSSESYTAPNPGAVLAVAGSAMSGATLWNTEALSLRASNSNPLRYGVWSWSGSLTGGNHIMVGAGSELTVDASTTAPQTQTLANSFRWYLPQLDGSRPAKPALTAQVTSPGVVTVGSTLTVALRFSNPTPYDVTYGASGDVITVPVNTAAVGSLSGLTVVSGGGTAIFTSPNVIWDPGTVPAGTTEEITFTVTVNIGTTGTFNVTNLPTVTNDDVGLNLAAGVGGAFGAYLDETGTRFRIGPICSVRATINATSTPAVISKQFNQARGSNVAVEFTTAAEAGSIGFNVLQNTAAGLVKLNSELIAAKSTGAFKPAIYSLLLPLKSAEPIWIEELADGGETTQHGPYAINSTVGSDLVLENYDWSASATEIASSAEQSQRNRRAQSAKGSMAWLNVDQDSLYRVSYEQLRSAGVDFSGIKTTDIALTKGGRGVARRIEGAAVFGAGSVIEFYGLKTSGSLYTERAIYALSENSAKAVNAERNAAASGDTATETAIQTFVHAPNLEYNFSSPNGDPWFAKGFARSSNVATEATFNFPVPSSAAGVAVSLTVDLWGGLDYPGDAFDHAVELSVNGFSQATVQFDGLTRRVVNLSLAAGILRAGSNQLVLRLLPTTGFSADRIHLEGVSGRFNAPLSAVNGVISFETQFNESPELGQSLFAGSFEADLAPTCSQAIDGTACKRFEIGGFGISQQNIVATAISNSGTSVSLKPTVVAVTGGFKASIQLIPESAQRIIVTARSLARSPQISLPPSPTPLLSGSASYLIIAHASLINGLAPLVSARTKEGFAVKVVDVEALYAAYSGGEVSPEAIKAYVKDAYTQLGVRYVLLAGGDSYDYANNLGINAQSLIPSFYRQTHPVVRFAPTDFPIADVNNDGRAEIAIGRIPARTLAELSNQIDKTLAYSLAAHPRTVVSLADRSANLGFAQSLSQWNLQLGASWSVNALTLDNFSNNAAGTAEAQAQFVGQLNMGRALTTYYGHSSPHTWSSSSVLNYQNLANGVLSNSSAPTIVAQAGCWGAYHVSPQFDALAHGWLTKNNSGAAALIGGSGLASTNADDVVFRSLNAKLTLGGRIGDLLNEARDAYLDQGGDTYEAVGLMLLGDPALKIRN